MTARGAGLTVRAPTIPLEGERKGREEKERDRVRGCGGELG